MQERKQPQDKQVDDVDGTQPKKYYTGLSKKDKEDRAQHFKKGSKTPAPGDDDAKTKPSKHTIKYKGICFKFIITFLTLKGFLIRFIV